MLNLWPTRRAKGGTGKAVMLKLFAAAALAVIASAAGARAVLRGRSGRHSRQAGHGHPHRRVRELAGRRAGLSRALSLGRPARRADRGFRHGDPPARPAAGGRAQCDRLGASDHRRRAALRALDVAADVRRDPGSDGDDRARLRGGGDRLSGPRHAGHPSLHDRGQRGPRGARHGARRHGHARARRQRAFRRLGPFAGRACRALYRRAGARNMRRS